MNTQTATPDVHISDDSGQIGVILRDLPDSIKVHEISYRFEIVHTLKIGVSEYKRTFLVDKSELKTQEKIDISRTRIAEFIGSCIVAEDFCNETIFL